ncbi:MAG: hypothetical protein AAF667_09865 [Pseudomonadota bacterium]
MTQQPFEYGYDARTPRAVLSLAAVLAGIIAMRVVFSAALWLVIPLVLLTVPAVWDVWRGHHGRLWIDERAIGWRTAGRAEQSVALGDIDKVNMRVGLDFSQRITLRLTDGTRRKVPLEVTPRGRAIEHRLAERGVTVDRGFFA